MDRGQAMRLRDYAVLYRRLVGAQIRGQMQYRVSFWLNIIGSFTITIADFGGVMVLFQRIPNLVGWQAPEVALLYGMAATSFGLAEMLAASLDSFDTFVGTGTFDRVLARPLPALFQVVTEDFSLRRLGRISQGVVVLLIAANWLTIEWTVGKAAILVASLVTGTAIFCGIFVVSASLCFWTLQGREASHVVTYGGEFTAMYPLDIHRGWLRRFLTFVLPLAFINYYPALYVLDRPDLLGLPPWAALLAPVAALAMGVVAWLVWRTGVRH